MVVQRHGRRRVDLDSDAHVSGLQRRAVCEHRIAPTADIHTMYCIDFATHQPTENAGQWTLRIERLASLQVRVDVRIECIASLPCNVDAIDQGESLG